MADSISLMKIIKIAHFWLEMSTWGFLGSLSSNLLRKFRFFQIQDGRFKIVDENHKNSTFLAGNMYSGVFGITEFKSAIKFFIFVNKLTKKLIMNLKIYFTRKDT